jgi:menaquinone-9 beta-reductase
MSSAIAIGGGVAGAAFALELARNGHRVVVLERTQAPHHKVCGEFLSAEAQRILSYLGLDAWGLGATPSQRLQLVCGESSANLELPFCGAGLSRFRLDQALLEAAAQAGAELVRGAAVTQLEWKRHSVIARTSGGNFEGTHVALATGKHELRDLSRPKASTVSFKMHFQLNPSAAAMLQRLVALAVFPGGYVGACLVEEGMATVCWVLERELLRECGTDCRSQLNFLSHQSSFVGDLLSGAKTLWEKPVAVASIPYGFLRRHVVSPLVYPVGDQLAVIPSYTGVGTAIALYSGIAAAQAILKSRLAEEYQKHIISLLRPRLAWALAANFIITGPRTQRMGAVASRLLPWTVPRIAAFIVGATRLAAFDLREVAMTEPWT